MRIGIDMDDTITDTYSVLIPKIAEFYNIDPNRLYKSRYDYSVVEHMPNFNEFMKKYRYDYLLQDVPIRFNAKEVINSLYDQGCEIYIVTARNDVEYDDPYLATKKCLEKNGIKYTKIIPYSNEKGSVCQKYNINLFIDDALYNCKDVADSNIKSLQIRTIFRPVGDICVVDNWKEIYDFIKNITGNIIV